MNLQIARYKCAPPAPLSLMALCDVRPDFEVHVWTANAVEPAFSACTSRSPTETPLISLQSPSKYDSSDRCSDPGMCMLEPRTKTATTMCRPLKDCKCLQKQMGGPSASASGTVFHVCIVTFPLFCIYVLLPFVRTPTSVINSVLPSQWLPHSITIFLPLL